MAKVGRKSKYERCVKPYLKNISQKIKEGVTEESIASSLGISVASLNNYKQQHAELREALSKDKGSEVLDELVNAGLESAKGYYKDIETTVIIVDEDGNPIKRQKTIVKQWYPANATLNKFYVQNYGKDKGFTNDPLEYELRKASRELDEAIKRADNWDKDL